MHWFCPKKGWAIAFFVFCCKVNTILSKDFKDLSTFCINELIGHAALEEKNVSEIRWEILMAKDFRRGCILRLHSVQWRFWRNFTIVWNSNTIRKDTSSNHYNINEKRTLFICLVFLIICFKAKVKFVKATTVEARPRMRLILPLGHCAVVMVLAVLHWISILSATNEILKCLGGIQLLNDIKKLEKNLIKKYWKTKCAQLLLKLPIQLLIIKSLLFSLEYSRLNRMCAFFLFFISLCNTYLTTYGAAHSGTFDIFWYYLKFACDSKKLVKSWQCNIKEIRTYFIWRVYFRHASFNADVERFVKNTTVLLSSSSPMRLLMQHLLDHSWKI